MATDTICELRLQTFWWKIVAYQNNTHPTYFVKKHQEDILTLPSALRLLKFPYLLVLAVLIKLASSTGVQMMFVSCYN